MKPIDKIHVRQGERPGPRNTGLCGKKGVSTISSAWGWWGPGGMGFEDVCKKCVKLERTR